MTPDARRVLAAQALRAFAYGLGSVLLGATFEDRGFGSGEVAVVLAAVVTGTVACSLAVGRWSGRLGRRRSYIALYFGLAVTGFAFAASDSVLVLALVALTGTLSTEVVESGPFTSLEQAMLATELSGRQRIRGFGTYNAIAAAAGSLGALAAGLPPLVRAVWDGAPADQRWFAVFVPVALAGAWVAWSLSPGVEGERGGAPRSALGPSRQKVTRLSALYAIDSLSGGFTTQAFIAYWLTVEFDASTATLGLAFGAIGVLQTVSFLIAARLGERFGLLNTMVFTHLPSNVLLLCLPLAPTLGWAIALLLARVLLSQMDVPTRQAYLMALVEPHERVAAAVVTNTTRYAVRPIGPLAAGAVQQVAFGLPFVISGTLKIVYDLALYKFFKGVELPDETDEASEASK